MAASPERIPDREVVRYDPLVIGTFNDVYRGMTHSIGRIAAKVNAGEYISDLEKELYNGWTITRDGICLLTGRKTVNSASPLPANLQTDKFLVNLLDSTTGTESLVPARLPVEYMISYLDISIDHAQGNIAGERDRGERRRILGKIATYRVQRQVLIDNSVLLTAEQADLVEDAIHREAYLINSNPTRTQQDDMKNHLKGESIIRYERRGLKLTPIDGDYKAPWDELTWDDIGISSRRVDRNSLKGGEEGSSIYDIGRKTRWNGGTNTEKLIREAEREKAVRRVAGRGRIPSDEGSRMRNPRIDREDTKEEKERRGRILACLPVGCLPFIIAAGLLSLCFTTDKLPKLFGKDPKVSSVPTERPVNPELAPIPEVTVTPASPIITKPNPKDSVLGEALHQFAIIPDWNAVEQITGKKVPDELKEASVRIVYYEWATKQNIPADEEGYNKAVAYLTQYFGGDFHNIYSAYISKYIAVNSHNPGIIGDGVIKLDPRISSNPVMDFGVALSQAALPSPEDRLNAIKIGLDGR